MNEIEVLEVIDQRDLDGINWRIERWPKYTLLSFYDNFNLIPNANISSIILEETDFEAYYKLRDIIKISTTLQIWNKINLAASVVEQMILEADPRREGFSN